MKFLSLLVFIFVAGLAHAQVSADEGLPSTGEVPMPPPAPDVPVQNPKEFNQDIDDFEKKISKEVPPAPAGGDKSAEKARAEMKKAHEGAGEAHAPKSGIAAHKEAIAAKKAVSKKAGKGAKKSGAAAKSAKGKGAGKKGKAAAKKKKKSAAE